MKKILAIIIFFLCCQETYSQDIQKLGVIQLDSTWTKEIIEFPIWFAKGIPYKGYEELRFHKDWAKEGSDGFWTYLMAWHIDGIQDITTEQLNSYNQFYYDGLVNGGVGNIPKAKILYEKIETDSTTKFRGTLNFFDGFHTKEMITLNVLVDIELCMKNNKTTVIFKVSPKPTKDLIWQKQYDIKLINELCNK